MTLRNVRPTGGDPITVWDNQFSHGYRADFYLVVAPDGQSRILRRPEQPAWDRNVPTPITIEPGKAWTLAGIANDAIVKSLKSLGLDTTQAGLYTITGYYEANKYQGDRVDRPSEFWGGQIATPPVEVRVGAAAAQGVKNEATVAWGEAVNELQAGLVPLAGVKDWKGFLCPNHTNGITDCSMTVETAASKRCCRVCEAPKPVSATFVEGEPMRMELHFRNLAKEARNLWDAGYGQTWIFTFTPKPAGPTHVFQTVWTPRLDSRRASTIQLGSGEQNAVELVPGEEGWGFTVVDWPAEHGRRPEFPSLSAGTYTVTASYAHPQHAQAKPCPYWHGTVSTGPVEIEIKPNDAMALFLDAAKYAGFAAVAEVKALPQPGDGEKPAQLGIAWKELLYAPDAARQAMTKVTALALPYLKPGVADEKATAGLKVGDKILVVVDDVQAQVTLTGGSSISFAEGKATVNLPEGGGMRLDGATWLPWSQSRQDALIAALAPGWHEGACPWCRRHEELFEGVVLGNCRGCLRRGVEKDGIVGLLCITCARQRGECSALFGNCKRTIGPATRDVTFRLWAFDPRVPQAKQLPNTCRIQPGEMSLPLWVEVKNEKGETPEFQTSGGGARFDCCDTLFYLVEGPGLSGPTAAFRCELARAMAPAALQKGSAVGPVELIGGKLFATPGTYTVHAVAGRLVSSSVTVIVEPGTVAQREAKEQAERQAEVERERQIERERELKQRATDEQGQ
jgi:hypothetical protein